jgi:hypothetical protein
MRPLTVAIAITFGFALAGPATANCAHTQAPGMCQWEERIAVEEWRAQQRAPALPRPVAKLK